MEMTFPEHTGTLRSIDVPEPDGTERHYFAGYASVYGVRCTYGEIATNGAYADTVKAGPANVKMLWGHGGPVIGSWTEFRENDYGLYVEGFVSGRTRKGREIIAAMKGGYRPGISTGRTYPRKKERQANGVLLLRLAPVDEISLCSLPAVPGATAVSRAPSHRAEV